MRPPEATAPPRRRFAGLNGIRALGATLVLTTHVGFHSGASLNTTFNGLLSRMDVGVAIFFVISGFLLFRPHAEAWLVNRSGPATRRYLWHRVLRIFPALWLAIVASALALDHPAEPVEAYLRHATMTQIYGSGFSAQGLTQMWSLATEVAFYLLLPTFAYALTRGRPTGLAVRIRLAALLSTPLLGGLWMAMTARHTEGLRALWLPGYIGWFGLGMALALWRTAVTGGTLRPSWLDHVARHPGTVWGVAAGLFLVLTSPVAGPYSLIQATPGQAAVKSILYALLAALIVLPTVTALSDEDDPPVVRRLGGRAATFFGDISYGIFCYHLIVLGVLEGLMDYEIFTGGFLRLFVPTLAVTVLLATASFYGVERPVMRWGRRGERRRTSAEPPFAGTTTTDTAMATSASS